MIILMRDVRTVDWPAVTGSTGVTLTQLQEEVEHMLECCRLRSAHLEHPGVAVVWTPGLVYADIVKGDIAERVLESGDLQVSLFEKPASPK